jgi:hypothetical protein
VDRIAARRWFWAAGALGLAIRLGYVFAYKQHAQAAGDAFYYHYQADLLVQGKWFVNPARYLLGPHQVLPAADHPPLWTLVLAAAAAVGVKGYLGQLIWACVVGAAGAVALGAAAHALAGPRVGVTAAVVAAVFPDFWINDGLLLSESLIPLVVGLMVLAWYRFRSRPTALGAAGVGAATALAALTRSELVLLVPLGVIWAAWPARTGARPGRGRLTCALAALGASAVLIGPWVGFNLARFREPVLISSELGATLAYANCDPAYYGPLVGYWSFSCVAAIHQPPGLDGPGQDAVDRRAAVSYIGDHEARVPAVVAARLGRDLGLYHPAQQLDLESSALARPELPAWLGLVGFYLAVLVAVPGVRVLRRRGLPWWPLLAVVADTLLAAAVTFGQSRYRVGIDVVVVVLAALALSAGRPAGAVAPLA